MLYSQDSVFKKQPPPPPKKATPQNNYEKSLFCHTREPPTISDTLSYITLV